jgi:hypothetical protein
LGARLKAKVEAAAMVDHKPSPNPAQMPPILGGKNIEWLPKSAKNRIRGFRQDIRPLTHRIEEGTGFHIREAAPPYRVGMKTAKSL